MKHLFLINPAAGKGKGLKIIKPQIEEYCTKNSIDFDVYVSPSQQAGVEYVKNAVAKGEPIRVYACGGDGTVYDVVNACYGNENAEVAAIPLGSGNDFVRLFGTREVFLNIDSQVNGTAVSLDVIRCGERIAINQCSMGLDAEICAKQAAFKKLPGINGELAYLLAAVYCLFRKVNNVFTITIDDGEPKTQKVLFAVMANSRWYGGGFKAAPLAIPDDGLIDNIVIPSIFKRINLFGMIGKYKKGEHINWGFTQFSRCKKVKIHSDELAAVNIDGETEYVHEHEFVLIENGIKFVVPKTSTYFNDRAAGKISQTS